MKLIAGLGNPDKKYAKNRHNVGFMVVNSFVTDEGHTFRINPDWLCHFTKAAGYIAIKPTTYVNKSGAAVLSVANFYNIDPKDILVVHDDLDIEFAKIRLSFGGSSAGHHGLQSVIESLGTGDFARLRVGIGSPRRASGEAGHPSPDASDIENYVLSDFLTDQMQTLAKVIKKCQEAIRSYIDLGIHATMNEFN